MLAINWVQQSGEYRALAYQAFNIAKLSFDKAVENNISNPAVLIDLDETLLDNTPYQAALIGTNSGFDSKTWNQWILAQETRAVPGAVEFIQYINDRGGKVFFISNRNQSSTNDPLNNDLEIATMNNMIDLGFTGVTEGTLLLKGEIVKEIDGKTDTSKKWRMEAVTNGLIDGKEYNAIIFIGDNLNDFSDIDKNNNQVRKEFVDNSREQHGVLVIDDSSFKPAYITLPNPIYGYWENGLYNAEKFNKESIWSLTPSEKFSQRLESLIKWNIQI